ncbi:hypothetical protein [Glaesserella parasuis]|uniref:hypothetical protein n=1 Tax=Glaesserella parasuis TaxID=738 RepID=UPI003B1733E3
MKQVNIQDYPSQVENLIDTRQSFEICGVAVGDMLTICAELEKYIESQNLKCRIYTKNRIAAGLAYVLNPAWGILSLTSIVAHNILTYDPDYEIYRDIANNRIGVEWKK